MVESSDKMWSTGEGNDKPLQYSCLQNAMNSMTKKERNDQALSNFKPYMWGFYSTTIILNNDSFLRLRLSRSSNATLIPPVDARLYFSL